MGAADPLHGNSTPETYWSTSNVGEAMPGVMTPLGFTLNGPIGDHCARETFYRMGSLTRAERRTRPVGEGFVRIFYGRAAVDVNLLCEAGDRLPGSSAEKIANSVIGMVPPGIVSTRSRRRYPMFAVKFPVAAVRTPRRARRLAPATAAWWPEQIARVPTADADQALAAFHAAAARLDAHIVDQTTMLFAVVQPMYEALGQLVTKAGVGDVGTLTGGYGGVPENAVVAALWDAAHGRIPLSDVVRRFGYHGPMEGEISGRVWREDDTPLRRLMADYSAADPDADPVRRETARREERLALEREVLAALPRVGRPAARALITLAGKRIPMRGLLKIAFLQALDVCRANARRLGELGVASGVLADPDDICYLTVDELANPLPAGAMDLVTSRRERREEYLKLRIPVNWQGMPQPITDDAELAPDGVLTGIGVSPGVVDGIARVVTDPTFAEVEAGEVLVARTTDPSWSSIMFVSAALVVDIGGALSHAAVVARELGIPCVVNSAVGTQVLHSGDRVRVDGSAGTVEILSRA